MKQIKFAVAVAALAVVTSQAQVFGLTVSDLGTTKPTYTNYYFSQRSFNQGGSYATSQQSTSNASSPGQTFFTTTAANLNSIIIKASSPVGSPATVVPWTLNIGVVTNSGHTFTSIFSDTSSVVPTPSNLDYIQFSLDSSILLAANTEYAFSITAGDGSNFFYLNGEDPFNGNPTTGAPAYAYGSTAYDGSGVIGEVGIQGSSVTTYNENTQGRTFYISATPVPEPSTWAVIPVLGTIAFLGYRRFRTVSSL